MIIPPSTADTCLYGSVVGMDNLLALPCHDNQSESPVRSAKCDECEQRPAQVTCDDCGLVYCTTCDMHRHRKGKLQLHQRIQIARQMSDVEIETGEICDVCKWLEAHDLGQFVEEAERQQLTIATLQSPEALNTFLDTVPHVSRGYKKKLQREVQKLQTSMEKAASEPAASVPSPLVKSRQRIGLDLRIDVESRAGGSSSPALRPDFKSLKIDVDKSECESTSALTQRSNGRPKLGALGLNIAEVNNEDKHVAASFDFSATGRLQTQGFEIDVKTTFTRGIANVPFAKPRQDEAHGKKSVSPADTISTKDYLVLLEELGQGAGGKVYKALYMPTFILVAVKVIRVYDQKKRHQMVRELRSLYVNFMPLSTATFPSAAQNQAACDDLVVFYDAYTNPEVGAVSIVLEYMDGGSLEEYVHGGSERKGKETSCFSEKEIANIAACGLKGLAFLHEHHQLHRDIKLSNILINHQGQVKISDFGISRDLESTLAKATTFTGTLLYMAPERISGGMYSYPSDIWSFGLALMACAIGKLPVPTQAGYWGVVHAVQEQPSPRLEDYSEHFSVEFGDFLDQCLQKNPLLRPSATRLLKHPFIEKNYSPREQANVHFLSRDRQPVTTKTRERSRQELKSIADKAQSWCQDHPDALKRLLCVSEGQEMQHSSSQKKIEVLAKQLRLPIEEVALHFAFLENYC